MESLRSSAIPTLDHDDVADGVLHHQGRLFVTTCCAAVSFGVFFAQSSTQDAGWWITAATGDIAGLRSAWKNLNVDPKTCCFAFSSRCLLGICWGSQGCGVNVSFQYSTAKRILVRFFEGRVSTSTEQSTTLPCTWKTSTRKARLLWGKIVERRCPEWPGTVWIWPPSWWDPKDPKKRWEAASERRRTDRPTDARK